ncbi:DUF3908 family protein [Neobacillus niacini]|uniref:DUF3908 family protein n=1 Tax=Neobacillus niacini TaxID=86668 RepID=UPI0021CB4561|nr:DUF3908 family protein [Neobacillus niacini]MCM3764617.1 DUF3908 family protein [Neobacillus niacini]
MGDNLSYRKFLEWFGNYSFTQTKDYYKLKNCVSKVKEFIPDSEIEFFYPQNLLVEDSDTDLIFLTKTKFIRISGSETKTFFEVFKLKDIIDFNFEVSEEFGIENVLLNIHFTNHRHLTFNNTVDTNKHWQNSFRAKIKGIYKMLIND